MEKQAIGEFYAKSFAGKIFKFIVYDNNTIDCPTLRVRNCNKIVLKPRFILIRNSYGKTDYEYKAPVVHGGENFKLISNYYINEYLFKHLKRNKMIIYSNDMAYFYGFEDKHGFDSEPGEKGIGSPYKRAKKKGPILVKQRRGQFN